MSDPFVPTTDKTSDDVGGIDTGNIDASEFETRGKTLVRTPVGYEFAPGDLDLPRITPEGVKVTQAQADELVEESDGLVIIVGNDEEGDDA